MNRIIFEDTTFSPLRLKLYVIWSLFTWAGFIPKVDIDFVFFFVLISKSRKSIEKQTSKKLPKSTQEEYKRGETPPLSPIPQPS